MGRACELWLRLWLLRMGLGHLLLNIHSSLGEHRLGRLKRRIQAKCMLQLVLLHWIAHLALRVLCDAPLQL